MKFPTLALAAVFLVSVCHAARPSIDLVQGAVTAEKPDKAILLVNYDVPPSHQEKFVELFKDLQDSVEHEEGVLVFGLSRTVDQNNIFYLYSEWDTQAHFSKHDTGESFQKFADEVAKINVVWKLHFLKQETSFVHH